MSVNYKSSKVDIRTKRGVSLLLLTGHLSHHEVDGIVVAILQVSLGHNSGGFAEMCLANIWLVTKNQESLVLQLHHKASWLNLQYVNHKLPSLALRDTSYVTYVSYDT